MNRFLFWGAFFLAFGVLFFALIWRGEWQIAGAVQGTWYHVTVRAPFWVKEASVAADINRRFEDIDLAMSTYRSDSEISRFNRRLSLEPMGISADFYTVLQAAKVLYSRSGGAFDPTVGPLVKRWGFFDHRAVEVLPTTSELRGLLRHVGFDKVMLLPGNRLQKWDALVQLDLDGIAQGYTVDVVAEVIRRHGIQDYLVEIGGEVVASGKNSQGKDWRVGINVPRSGSEATSIYRSLSLHNQAVTTSGGYRNFVKYRNKFYSHILNPKTGFPVETSIASVSVVAPTALIADALDTTLIILGIEKGNALLEHYPGTRALYIMQTSDGRFRSQWSK